MIKQQANEMIYQTTSTTIFNILDTNKDTTDITCTHTNTQLPLPDLDPFQRKI